MTRGVVYTHSCGARWHNLRNAHCVGCHETFSSDTNFDLHRRGMTCLPPDCRGKLTPKTNPFNTVVWTGTYYGDIA